MENPEIIPQQFEDFKQKLTLYSGIADYYDFVMKATGYDYEAIAKAACSIIGKRRKILELGVGTGLLAEQLVTLEPNYEYTGVDISSAMLKIAQNRLGERATLIEADICKTELKDTFDTAISCGGIWFIFQQEDEYELASHILSLEENIQALKKVAKHLLPKGLLLLNSYPMNKNNEKFHEIESFGGIEFHYESKKLDSSSDYSLYEKSIILKSGNEIVGQNTLILKNFKGKLRNEIIREGGFELQEVYEINARQHFYLYQVIPLSGKDKE